MREGRREGRRDGDVRDERRRSWARKKGREGTRKAARVRSVLRSASVGSREERKGAYDSRHRSSTQSESANGDDPGEAEGGRIEDGGGLRCDAEGQ